MFCKRDSSGRLRVLEFIGIGALALFLLRPSAICQGDDFGDRPLGWLSELEESANAGSATVSSGKGDPGGVSYGIYQLSSTQGAVKAFVDEYYASQFAGLRPGTSEFTQRWVQLSNADEDTLAANQYAFIKQTHYDVMAQRLRDGCQFDIEQRTLARATSSFRWQFSTVRNPP